MGPRKRPKPNPKAEAESQPPPSLNPEPADRRPDETSTDAIVTPDKPAGAEGGGVSNDGVDELQSSKTWYRGTWPRSNKATPITQVAKESISAAGSAAFEAVASARAQTPPLPTTPLKSPAVYLSRSIGSSSRSLPLAATTTKLNITSSATSPENGAAKEGQPSNYNGVLAREKNVQSGDKVDSEGEKLGSSPPGEEPSKKSDAGADSNDAPLEEVKSTNDSSGWLNWFSRTENARTGTSSVVQSGSEGASDSVVVKNRPQSTAPEVLQDAPQSPQQRRNSEPNPVSPKAQQDGPPRSWLGLWGNTSTQNQSSSSARATGIATNPSDSLKEPEPQSQPQRSEGIKLDPAATFRPPPQLADAAKSYGWAFWSRDQSKNDYGNETSENNVGQLALAGSPSQSKPEDAVVDEALGVPDKVGKRQRPPSFDLLSITKKVAGVDDSSKKASKPGFVPMTPKSKPTADAGTKAKQLPQNLLLPSFKRTYITLERPSFFQQIGRLLQISPPLDSKHVDIVQYPPRVKRALAIGVHGYFPAPLIRSVLGQPTGTSIRFANNAASAIQKWTQNQGYSCEIEKVALEGEGRIAERIDLLWKLMLNWIDKIRKADFVMIACHSQGVPVAMMLVAKLIAMGCVNSAKIGVCAMAGVNLGPFADYKSRWISGSAGELFEFARPDSQVSKDYHAALDIALRFGVRIVYVGSIDDQLVSLESSTFGIVNHPYIFRAVFIDGRVHAPDFLTHLVGFALKLRNLGIPDHGLIRELSLPLAGSLYGGEGHSRIYDDESLYYLAVEHALETTSVGDVPLQIQQNVTITSQNPYILPFAMRGLLEEEYVRTELYCEITELIKQFDDWKPSSKVLKDVKFRLEGVRSKL